MARHLSISAIFKCQSKITMDYSRFLIFPVYWKSGNYDSQIEFLFTVNLILFRFEELSWHFLSRPSYFSERLQWRSRRIASFLTFLSTVPQGHLTPNPETLRVFFQFQPPGGLAGWRIAENYKRQPVKSVFSFHFGFQSVNIFTFRHLGFSAVSRYLSSKTQTFDSNCFRKIFALTSDGQRILISFLFS